MRTMRLSRVRKAGRKGGAELEHEHRRRRAREIVDVCCLFGVLFSFGFWFIA